MAEIEFLPPPPQASSSESPGSERVDSNRPGETVQVGSPFTASSLPTSFRALTPDEIQANVLPDYTASGNPLPDPSISTFIGALQDNKVIAYLCLQVKLHAQPLVIRDGHAGVLKSLVAAAEAHILSSIGPTWVYLFTPAGKLAQMAQTMGMQMEPWVVMSKLVQPEPPARPVFEVITHEPPEPGPFPERDEFQSRPDDEVFDSLFPNGVMNIDPSGRVQ